MKNILFKRSLVCGIILLFLGLCVTSSIGVNIGKISNKLTKEAPANFLAGGLLAYWKLDDGSGNSATDSSGHGYDGTVQGATWVTGGLDFDGVDDYVDLDTHSVKLGYNKTDDYAFIVKFKSTSDGMMYSTSHTDPARPYADLKLESGGKISFKTGDQSCLFDVTTSNSYNNNQMHTVEVLFFGSTTNPTVTIYVDKTLDGTQTKWLCPILDTDFLTAKMGRKSNAATDFYDGVLDEIKLYKYPTGNQAPNKPAKPGGPTSGTTGTSYTFTASTTDPDGDQVEYWFDWGDTTNSGWVSTGSATHTWTNKNTYSITVKARDLPMREESAISDALQITITKDKSINVNYLLLRLLGQHPNLFLLIKNLLGQ